MLYTEKTKKALTLCFEAHKGQRDKSGLPYAFHPFHLAEQMTTEDTTVAALLHDVAEDTDYTLDDLAAMGFGEAVMNALALLTHGDDVDYMDYVRAIAQNPIAKAVKIADLRHNSDITRLDAVDEKASARREKYRAALALLAGDNNGAANMRRTKFYVCPACGNVIHAVGEALVSCCGITLPPLEAEECDAGHAITLQAVEDEHFLTVHHPMTKEHFISFAAFVSADRVQLVKFYPEGNAETRLNLRGGGFLYIYCNRHGLMKRKV